MNKFRERLAVFIVLVWAGGLLLILGVDLTGWRTIDAKEYLSAYSHSATPLATLVMGYYFGTKAEKK